MNIRVVLFDIDGTLVNSGGAGRRALELAFERVHEVRDAGRNISFDGKTDPRIYDEICDSLGIEVTAENRIEFLHRYILALRRLAPAAPGATELPGVRVLLERLRMDHRPLGLLTGNVRIGAGIKLDRFNLGGYFIFGAYGDEANTRNDIAALALDRGRDIAGDPALDPQCFIVVGDTPHDVSCGKSCGMRTLAVATGSRYKLEELEAAGADLSVSDLTKTDRIISWIADGAPGC
jgi:phosphoglycolate phosphatase-like HAD superfamily hydrolase